jgi:hypothetical protein
MIIPFKNGLLIRPISKIEIDGKGLDNNIEQVKSSLMEEAKKEASKERLEKEKLSKIPVRKYIKF